jgi:putative methyltransferase (TIGR04325 family)
MEISKKVLAATLKVKNGIAAYERDTVIFDKIQYSWPITAGLFWAAARNSGNLSVLDFGGAMGSSYFQNREFFDGLKTLHWSVIEQSHLTSSAKKFIQNNQLKFYNSIDECIKTQNPNVIILSSVLQYLESPNLVLQNLTKSNADIMIIDRTPFSSKSTNSQVIQHVSPQIYDGSYPMHVFSEQDFLEKISKNWLLIAEFISPEGEVSSPAGDIVFKGFIFRNKNL